MMSLRRMLSNRNVIAWLLLVSALALHVLDETLTDFLPFYNQLVLDLRQQVGFLPLPTFSFAVWLGGLVVGIVLAYLVTVLVNRGGVFIRVFATAFGVIMIVNACGHLGGSLYFGRVLPGVWSSPLLLLASGYVVTRGVMGDWQRQPLTDASSDIAV